MAAGANNGMYTRPDRRPTGERNGASKLTWDRVRFLREEYRTTPVTYKELSVREGVHLQTIYEMIAKITWKEEGKGKR